jgi:hypothetical protein
VRWGRLRMGRMNRLLRWFLPLGRCPLSNDD